MQRQVNVHQTVGLRQNQAERFYPRCHCHCLSERGNYQSSGRSAFHPIQKSRVPQFQVMLRQVCCDVLAAETA